MVQRAIVGYELDAEGDWTAILECRHRQHVRHNPPLVSRPWVLTEAGRQRMLGRMLNCVRCDRGEPPPDEAPPA
jgi:hypothetical protein